MTKIINWIKSKIHRKHESGLVEFARSELNGILDEIKDKNSDSYVMQKNINDDIIEIVVAFSKQGHSGFSASYVLNIIKRLLDWKPIRPLTGDDSEWVDCGYCDKDGNKVFQNKRCSAVFKTVDEKTGNSKSNYIDKYTISDDGGLTWMHARHVLDKLGLNENIEFPFKVPEKPIKIYIKYTENVPLGESSDNFIDITGIPEEIEELRKISHNRYHQ